MNKTLISSKERNLFEFDNYFIFRAKNKNEAIYIAAEVVIDALSAFAEVAEGSFDYQDTEMVVRIKPMTTPMVKRVKVYPYHNPDREEQIVSLEKEFLALHSGMCKTSQRLSYFVIGDATN